MQAAAWQQHAGTYLRDAEAATGTAAALTATNKQLRAQLHELTEAANGDAQPTREQLQAELEDVRAQLAAAKRRAANDRLSAKGRARCAVACCYRTNAQCAWSWHLIIRTKALSWCRDLRGTSAGQSPGSSV